MAFSNKQYMGKIWKLLDQLCEKDLKEQYVEIYTKGRTTSMGDMENHELCEMYRGLKSKWDSLFKKLRGKIVHLACNAGMVHPDNRPNFDKINAWVEKRGGKDSMFFMNKDELTGLINQLTQWNERERKKGAAGRTDRVSK